MIFFQQKKQAIEPCVKKLEAERSDMQGLITHGYKYLPAARYLLLEISDMKQAKDHLNLLIDTEIIDATESREIHKKGNSQTAVQIAFTSSGLKALKLPKESLDTFSREFLEGMTFDHPDDIASEERIKERSTILGDIGSNDPRYWHWGNEANPVDCILMLYAKDEGHLKNLTDTVLPGSATGLKLVHIADTHPYDPDEPLKEHFGFRDGISQPIVKGLPKSIEAKKDDDLVNMGEFILGHPNAYNAFSPRPYVTNFKANVDLHDFKINPDNEDETREYPETDQYVPCSNGDPINNLDPGKKDLGKNGTYLVFRTMEQHVERFWNYMYHFTKEDGPTRTERAIKLASKMIGRWPDGQSLAMPREASIPVHLNKFLYNEKDKNGLGCPFGAHVRRANPRDQVHAGRGAKLSLEMSNKHRMLRRGRLYGEPLIPGFDIEKMIEKAKDLKFDKQNGINKIEMRRGIHFMCLVSDIARQFEFVQSVWANTRTFGDLDNEVDPIISARHKNDQEQTADFTTPQLNVRNRYKAVPEFTNVLGGAYFFMPGFKTLRYLLSNTVDNQE